MGVLTRWDEHNQRVMDRIRAGSVPVWTIPAAIYVGFQLMWIVGHVVPWMAVAVVVDLVIATVTTVGVVRLARSRRGRTSRPQDRGSSPVAPRF